MKQAHSRSESDRLKLQNRIQKLIKDKSEIEKSNDEATKQLKQNIQALELAMKNQKQNSAEHQMTASLDKTSTQLTDFDKTTLKQKSSDELIGVISHLIENSQKTDSTISTVKYMHLVTQNKQLKKLLENSKQAENAKADDGKSLEKYLPPD